jgi:thiol-disulfide isomerase/thioredoxin
MRKYLFMTALILCLNYASIAQAQYEISYHEKHPNEKIFKGIINKYLLANENSFVWMQKSQVGYNPDTATIGSLERAKNNIQFLIFGGTWCEDTQAILPKFFKLQEISGVPDNAITLLGVDREKKTLANFTSAFKITNVPTIIILKNGLEVGRVVEYGKTGKWDKEIAAIVAN